MNKEDMMPPLVAEDLLSYLDAHSDELLDFLAASIRRQSESGWEDRVSGLYVDWLTARGWPITRSTIESSGLATDEPRAGQRENVIAWYPRRRGLPTLVLNGHIDVVPAGDEAAWSRPPFSGERANGCVYGRGSVDMKAGIAAGLYALEALSAAGVDLPFDVALELVVAEETTGVGTRMTGKEVSDPAAVLVLEPTGGAVVPISTGLLFFTIDVTGVSAHTSAPWRGVDAFEKLVLVRGALAQLARERGESYRHPLFADVPTAIPFAIGITRAGSWRAAVPDHATMSGRIGLKPGESIAALRQDVLDTITKVVANDTWLTEHPPLVRWDHEGLPGWETPLDHPLIGAFRAAQLDLTGNELITGFTAGSDAAYFGAQGIPTAIFGPGDVTLAHSPDEHVVEADVIEAAKVIALAIANFGLRNG